MEKILISWYNEIPVAGFIWTLSPEGLKNISVCYPAELDKLQESVWNIIMEILLVILDYVLQCFYYLLQNTRDRERERERACIIESFGIYNHYSLTIFLLGNPFKDLKILYPLLRVFHLDQLQWHLWQDCWELVTKASIALHGNVRAAPPFTFHFQQGKLLPVERQVSREEWISSLPPSALAVCWWRCQFCSLIIFITVKSYSLIMGKDF